MRLDRTPGGRLVSILQGGVLPCLGLLLALLPGRSAAQELYVSDYREVPVWLSASPDSEVFATLKTGDAVQRVHQEGEYYLAVLPNGRRRRRGPPSSWSTAHRECCRRRPMRRGA